MHTGKTARKYKACLTKYSKLLWTLPEFTPRLNRKFIFSWCCFYELIYFALSTQGILVFAFIIRVEVISHITDSVASHLCNQNNQTKKPLTLAGRCNWACNWEIQRQMCKQSRNTNSLYVRQQMACRSSKWTNALPPSNGFIRTAAITAIAHSCKSLSTHSNVGFSVA